VGEACETEEKWGVARVPIPRLDAGLYICSCISAVLESHPGALPALLAIPWAIPDDPRQEVVRLDVAVENALE
jgi:hypothetical protein